MAVQSTNDDGAQSDESEVAVLGVDDSIDALNTEDMFLGQVRDVQDYGVFVAFTPQEMSDVSGLAHKSNLPPLTKPRDFNVGSRVVVGVDALTHEGPQLVLAYGDDVNPEDLEIPDERPAMPPNPDPHKCGSGGGSAHAVDERLSSTNATATDGAGVASADAAENADAPTAAHEIAELTDELWALREEIEELKDAQTDAADNTGPVLNGASFAEDPLKDTALDLLRLAETDAAADTVSKEQLKGGTVRYTVTVSSGSEESQ